MTTRLMDGGVRSPEAAKRLGLRGRDVYLLLFVIALRLRLVVAVEKVAKFWVTASR